MYIVSNKNRSEFFKLILLAANALFGPLTRFISVKDRLKLLRML